MPTQRPAINVVHVLTPAEYGGLETVVLALAAGQAAMGDEVSVLPVLTPNDPNPHPFCQALEERGIHADPLFVSGRNYRSERAGVREILETRKTSVLHSHGYRTDVVDASVAKAMGLATVSTVHGRTGGGWRNRFYEWLQERAWRRFDAVVAVSGKLRGELMATGIGPGRVRMIRNAWSSRGVVVSRDAARDRLGLPDSGHYIGFVGRLSAEKGPDVFIRAAAAMEGIEARFCIVGSGPLESECRALAVELGVADRIVWLGAVRDAGLSLRAFDVLALTSWTEGTPMVLLEAMSAGVPVVATSVGGVPDVVSPEEAIVRTAGDWAALAAAFTEVLTDREATERRVAAARRRLRQDFSVESWVSEYRAVYDSILKAE
jgi:glycosyltransferase involved in cell wall biosynthesis